MFFSPLLWALLLIHYGSCYNVVRQPFQYEMCNKQAKGIYEDALEFSKNLADQTSAHLYEIIHDDVCLESLVSETREFSSRFMKGNKIFSVGHLFVIRYAIASALYANFLHRTLADYQFWEVNRIYEAMMHTAKLVSMSQGDIIEAMRFDRRFEVHGVEDGRTLITFSDDIEADLAKTFIKSIVFNDVFMITGRNLNNLRQFINASETYPHYASKRMLLVMEELVFYVEILQRLFLLGSRDKRYGLQAPKDPLPDLQNYMDSIEVLCDELFDMSEKPSRLSFTEWKARVFRILHNRLENDLETRELDRKLFPEFYSTPIPLEDETKQETGESPTLRSTSAPEQKSFLVKKTLPAARRASQSDLRASAKCPNCTFVSKRYYEMLDTIFNHQRTLNWNHFKSLMTHLNFRIRGVGGGSVFEFRKENIRFIVHRPHPCPEMTRGKLKWVSLELKKVYPNGLGGFKSK